MDPEKVKPLLIPLIEITLDHQVELSKVDENVDWGSFGKYGNTTTGFNSRGYVFVNHLDLIKCFSMLASWHYDLFNLITQGKALNKLDYENQ